ncbi:MAG: hydroxypyruvate isomerase, partial [Actinomycetota bacterium]|nr:hydroxypyruvate isomerase [Actinomycetota bacterium]
MTHSLRYAVNCSLLFTELPLLDRPAAAKAAGFDAVEFWWPWPLQPVPPDAEVRSFVDAVRNAGVTLVGLNFFAGDLTGADAGVLS